ncbi:hypothetical protein [Methylobacterium sp. CM6257]
MALITAAVGITTVATGILGAAIGTERLRTMPEAARTGRAGDIAAEQS